MRIVLTKRMVTLETQILVRAGVDCVVFWKRSGSSAF
jgi:hypothetical protein